ncbi:MAG: hypothetical protein LBV41_03275 [Cytophagaceae bacterium]|jgi:hypothetical protein|nr:hypothetical protein [Cytophagaceae bacterium]
MKQTILTAILCAFLLPAVSDSYAQNIGRIDFGTLRYHTQEQNRIRYEDMELPGDETPLPIDSKKIGGIMFLTTTTKITGLEELYCVGDLMYIKLPKIEEYDVFIVDNNCYDASFMTLVVLKNNHVIDREEIYRYWINIEDESESGTLNFHIDTGYHIHLDDIVEKRGVQTKTTRDYYINDTGEIVETRSGTTSKITYSAD